VDAFGSCRQFGVAFVKRSIRRIRNRIVRITPARGVFIDDASLAVPLSGQVLKFGDSRVGMIVRVIHNSHGLQEFHIEGFMFKAQGPIGQFSISEIEELIHRPGIDNLSELYFVNKVSKIAA
jgi:hypothetical protein